MSSKKLSPKTLPAVIVAAAVAVGGFAGTIAWLRYKQRLANEDLAVADMLEYGGEVRASARGMNSWGFVAPALRPWFSLPRGNRRFN